MKKIKVLFTKDILDICRPNARDTRSVKLDAICGMRFWFDKLDVTWDDT